MDVPVLMMIIEPNVQVATHTLCSQEVPNLNLDREVRYSDWEFSFLSSRKTAKVSAIASKFRHLLTTLSFEEEEQLNATLKPKIS